MRLGNKRREMDASEGRQPQYDRECGCGKTLREVSRGMGKVEGLSKETGGKGKEKERKKRIISSRNENLEGIQSFFAFFAWFLLSSLPSPSVSGMPSSFQLE